MTHPIAIADIDHIVLRVADLETMLGFYQNVLGCLVERRNDKQGLVHLRAGRSLIDLVTLDGPLGRKGGQGPGLDRRNVDHFCLRVKSFDPDSIVAFLQDQGLAVDDATERFGADGFGLSIYLTDPESNVIELRGESS